VCSRVSCLTAFGALVFASLTACGSGGPSAVELSLTTGEGSAPALLVADRDVRRWPHDPWSLEAYELDGDELRLDVSYGGGCREHRFAFLVNPAFMESHPVAVSAWLAHDADGDMCRALLRRILRFDLSPLRQRFTASYGPGPGTVVLHLHGASITYRF